LDRYAAVDDRINIERHKEDVERWPGIMHTLETVEQVKKSLKDPEIHKKIENYVKKTHMGDDLEMTDITFGSGAKGFSTDKVINAMVVFKYKGGRTGEGISKNFLDKHNLYAVYAVGNNIYDAAIPIPLSVLELK
jgi:hypothetical protein